MKWSFKLARIAGIDVFVHWTFLLLVSWIFVSHISQGHTTAMAIEGVLFILSLFGCVVLHEFGHALTARRFGVATRDITLLPIGGVARLERMPEEPMQEFWVAIAGPAVNVVIAIVLFGLLAAKSSLESVSNIQLVGGDFVGKLLVVNIVLVVFNMLPAFPMDGGRVLRALLARNGDYVRATQTAASVGQVMAIGFGILGFFTNWFLLFIALFVYIGAQQEAHLVQVKAAMNGVPVKAAMLTKFETLSESDTLQTAVSLLLAGDQQDFPVLARDRLTGVLTRGNLIAALADGKIHGQIADVMRRDCRTATEHEMLDAIFVQMQEGGCSVLPVLRGNKVVGILNLENIGEWMMIQTALKNTARNRSGVNSVVKNRVGVPATRS